jgi:hypothetical protein
MQRAGATLVEVLVAIFVMGIGLIAILALFPLGILRMQQAIQDNHCANIAFNAEAIATMKLLGQDAAGNPESIRHDYKFITTCQTPGGGLTDLTTTNMQGPSYPVFIDPIGSLSSSPTTGYQSWLAATPTIFNQGYIPRIILPSIQYAGQAGSIFNPPTTFNPSTVAIRWFTFRDDFQFAINGLPQFTTADIPQNPPPPPYFYRETRYSWGLLCQLPKVADPAVVNMAVVVYNRRTMGMGGNLSLSEYFYDSKFDTNRNIVTVTVNAKSLNTPPPVRLGEWILDCTLTTNPSSAHGYFYRVVSITDNGDGTFDLEVQTPFRGFIGSNITQTSANSGIYFGQAMILEGVVEVFERNSGRQP